MKRIVWDKGHGGTDPGAVGNGLQEKNLTHSIVSYAMNYLEANYTGFEQRTTRTGDQTLELSKRDDMANAWGADAFISAHINAGGGTGFETFIFNGTTNPATSSLQNSIHDEVLKAMRKIDPSVKDRGKKRANFAVLRTTNMPAVLTETLFIDTVADANHLKSAAFLKAVGEAHAIGVAKYLGLKELKKVAEKPKPQPQKEPVVDWAATSWEKAQKKKGKDGKTSIMNGQNPNDPITRKQMAAVLDRLGLLD
ncbi:N-acetylmuramoyl-L-alanine amidase [Solibacillus sp. FSL W8-0474]|uniref:N-acetylmuramoyl-L-alanine amidase family protein n=1 Tax=Solibacillus sp. FSL W8-0474 TaxID=2975336 RepID=UPI0030F5953E